MADDQTAQRFGTVYVLTNPAIPGLVKIGRTDGAVALRVDQLYTSGVPFPFRVEFACRVANTAEVERALHQAFAFRRVNARREFFEIAPENAIAILRLLHVEEITEVVEAQAGQGVEPDEEAGERFAEQRRSYFVEFGDTRLPLKDWVRQHPETMPAGMDLQRANTHQMVRQLIRANWTRRDDAANVILVPPAPTLGSGA